ncbi:MAG: anion permease [Deltaproteobacteria bacterium]|nr:anion permease [Deltaproteobacteria bacterium]MBW2153317.1 anion permease [Deltaproteobacteria bacterium]
MWKIVGGIFLGWGLGSNDCANIFGTGVAANVIQYRTAILLTSVFLIIGALLEGYKSMSTVGEMSNLSPTSAFIATFAAGICMGVFSCLSLPVSASQAIMGAVLGIGLITGIPDLSNLYKVVLCWVLTPIGGIFVTTLLYSPVGKLFANVLLDIQRRTALIRAGLFLAGCYGAYSLGANNVANVTGVYVGSGLLTPFHAALIGSLSIASGVLTYSKKVMDTVGKKIVELDGYSAFISTLSAAITVHVFTQVGVPVSTSQAIVGGVAGIGIIKGSGTVRKRTVIEIAIGWVSTPLSSGVLAYLMMWIYINLFGGNT